MLPVHQTKVRLDILFALTILPYSPLTHMYGLSYLVYYTDAVDSLECARHYLELSHRRLCNVDDARKFIDSHMSNIIYLLLQGEPKNVNKECREYTKVSLQCSLQIINHDLLVALEHQNQCPTLYTLCSILSSCYHNKSGSLPTGWTSHVDSKSGRTFYFNKEQKKSSWVSPNRNQVRDDMINFFQSIGGISRLAQYLGMIATTDHFPSWAIVTHLLQLSGDSLSIKKQDFINLWFHWHYY